MGLIDRFYFGAALSATEIATMADPRQPRNSWAFRRHHTTFLTIATSQVPGTHDVQESETFWKVAAGTQSAKGLGVSSVVILEVAITNDTPRAFFRLKRRTDSARNNRGRTRRSHHRRQRGSG